MAHKRHYLFPHPLLLRHVARLRRFGATKNFRGGGIVTGHRTQLTVAITDSATTMKMGYKTMLRATQRS